MDPIVLINSPVANMLISIVFFGIYNVIIKNFPKLLVLLLWASLIAHLMYFVIFSGIRNVAHGHAAAAAMAVSWDSIFAMVLKGAPIYALNATLWLSTQIMLKKLYKHYPITAIAPLLEVSIIVTTVGFAILGETITLKTIIGVTVIFIGCLVSAMKGKTIIKSIKSLRDNLDNRLIKLSLLFSLFTSLLSIVNYVTCAHKAGSDLLSRYLRTLPTIHTAYTVPTAFELGSVIFIDFVILGYLIIREIRKRDTFAVLFKHFPMVLLTSGLQFAFAYTHMCAQNIAPKETVITAMNRLTGPAMVLFAFLLLKEKPKKQDIIGSGIIILGAVAWLI